MSNLLGPLGVTSTFPFVGRSAELERLRLLMPRAAGEGGRAVLIGGEAGSGKSRLVREFAAGAARDGALVLHGACDAVVHTPYGPFVEALDQLTRAVGPDELRVGRSELARLLPELATGAAEGPRAADTDPDTERHRLHTAVADVLAGVTRRRPALLVLEDGHWADAPTLHLLRHLVRAGTPRVFLLATFRDAEADVPEALAETLADLRRYDVVRLRLAGLSGDEVAEFVRLAAGSELVPPELAPAIRDLTDGNPFLVCELWRALVETGAVELAGGAIRVHRSPEELGKPREHPRGVAPAPRAAGAAHDRRARAGRHGGDRVPARARPARGGARRRRVHGGAGRGGPQRHDRGDPVARAGLPVRPRAGAARAL